MPAKVEEKSRPVPSVGRMVHYWTEAWPELSDRADKLTPLAATVASVATPGDPESPCYLSAIDPLGAAFQLTLDLAVPFAKEPTAGHWSWPVFVPPIG